VATSAPSWPGARDSHRAGSFTPHPLLKPRPICVRMAGVRPTCASRDYLRPAATPPLYGPSCQRDLYATTAPPPPQSRSSVSGWGIRERRPDTGWDPLPAPCGCSPGDCPGTPITAAILSPSPRVRWCASEPRQEGPTGPARTPSLTTSVRGICSRTYECLRTSRAITTRRQ